MKDEEANELNIEELDEVAGGGFTLPEAIKNKNNEQWVMSHGYSISSPKYCCPKCRSRNVNNIDIGEIFVMRVKCYDCGYFGERGSISETSI